MSVKAKARKDEIISGWVKARRRILDTAASLSQAQRDEVFLGTWSAKDLVAHLIGWDFANVEATKAVLAGELPPFYAHHDRDWKSYNARLVAQYKRDDFAAMLAAAKESQQVLLAFLETVPAEEFSRDRNIRFRGYKVTIARLLQAEAKDEEIHYQQIRAFESKGGKRMNTVELLQYSLGSAFDILGQVTADLTQEQADWQPPGIANPIGAMYWHTISGADDVIYRWALGQEPLRQREGWDERVLTASVPEPGHGGDYLAYMRAIRVDLPALHDYAKAVAEALQGWLGSLTPGDLERTLNTPIGEHTLAQMLDTFVIWHINAHCGEISALKGCQGARGYPF